MKFLCLLREQTGKAFCSQLRQVWRDSPGGTGGESMIVQDIHWLVANQSARETLSIILVYTKSVYKVYIVINRRIKGVYS